MRVGTKGDEAQIDVEVTVTNRGDQPADLKLYYELGVDGLFADNADTAVAVREATFNRAPAR